MKSSTLFTTTGPLVLASSSPRRQQMLHALGIDFDISPAHIDETPFADEDPEHFAKRMARTKALSAALSSPHSWVLGADTVVSIDKGILGKPRDHHEALAFLKLLVNRTHEVITSVSLCHTAAGFEETISDRSLVTFTLVPDAILEAYVNTGEPLDKAGAYGIQGIGSFLVRSIKGSCTNVIGLPVDSVVLLLLAQGVIEPRA